MVKQFFFILILNSLLLSASPVFNDFNEYGKSSYITGDIKFSELDNTSVMFIGSNFGIIFDDKFYAGAGIYTSMPNYFSNGEIVESNIKLTYMGGTFGITLGGDSPLHTNFSVLVGGGNATDITANTTDFVLILEPEAAIEFNITNFSKIKLAWSWRLTQGVDAKHVGNGLFGSTFLGGGYGDMNSINLSFIFGEY